MHTVLFKNGERSRTGAEIRCQWGLWQGSIYSKQQHDIMGIVLSLFYRNVFYILFLLAGQNISCYFKSKIAGSPSVWNFYVGNHTIVGSAFISNTTKTHHCQRRFNRHQHFDRLYCLTPGMVCRQAIGFSKSVNKFFGLLKHCPYFSMDKFITILNEFRF